MRPSRGPACGPAHIPTRWGWCDTPGPVRLSRAIRVAAWGTVAVGFVAPLVRRRLKTPAIVTQVLACAAPVGLAVAVPRSRRRDVALCFLQMWAYLHGYQAPHDDPARQARRARIDYPIRIDRILGFGELPTVRLQRALAGKGPWRSLDRVLVWTHWAWFAVPHVSLAYILWRRPAIFPRSAVMTYAVFDIGAVIYWIAPTAPPWFAAMHARRLAGEELSEKDIELVGDPAGLAVDIGRGQQGLVSDPPVRRLMAEYGEVFWRDNWGRLYSVLGGNPLAAMPSLHFGTSVMAAFVLRDVGPISGAIGRAYALTLGFSLVYLGEHYLSDLVAGAALAVGVRRAGPFAEPMVRWVGRAVSRLEAAAHEAA